MGTYHAEKTWKVFNWTNRLKQYEYLLQKKGEIKFGTMNLSPWGKSGREWRLWVTI